MPNWRSVKSAFDRELRGYPHSVRYTHYDGECPCYYVTMYGMADYDDDDAEYIFDAFDRIEEQFDLGQNEIDSSNDPDVTYQFLQD